MRKTSIVGGALAALLLVVALVLGWRTLRRLPEPAPTPPPATESATSPAGAVAAPAPGLLYGRVTTVTGTTYEGRLRWGGHQEAFWGDYFNGAPRENRWAAQVPDEELPRERRKFEIFGFGIGPEERPIDLVRPFMVRFGDLARIEVDGVDVRVTLKSGTVVPLNRLDASDVDDGLRVWDGRRGVVDLDSLEIRTVELLPSPGRSGTGPERLHGTVHTSQGDFTGFVQWDGERGLLRDSIYGLAVGDAGDEAVGLRFDTLRSIARRSRDTVLVTRRDGSAIELGHHREIGDGNRGITIDDRRLGRVRVSWEAFERLDLTTAEGAGPGYDDFPPGHPLTGSVTTRDGRRLAGRLVYDLDEAETTETLDAASGGVGYTLPFGLVAAVVPRAGESGARVTLHGGETLQLERTGDLGAGNAGLLVFVDGEPRPRYVRWTDVERIDLDRPPAMFPPLGDG